MRESPMSQSAMTQSPMTKMVEGMSAHLDLSDADAVNAFNDQGFGQIGNHLAMIHRIPSAFFLNFPGAVELGPNGIESWSADRAKPTMHVIFAGTPHRVPHGFGWWHINAHDELHWWIPGPDDFTTFIEVEKVREGDDVDQIAWYCQNCLNMLHCVVYESGKHSDAAWAGIMEAERLAVEEFNADDALRTCDNCSAEHPMAYRDFMEPGTTLTPEEEAARAVW